VATKISKFEEIPYGRINGRLWIKRYQQKLAVSVGEIVGVCRMFRVKISILS